MNWPIPKNVMEVRSFLGLVRYIAVYLPKLAEYMHILMPLTTKECWKVFLKWMGEHQNAFEAIKGLVFPWLLVSASASSTTAATGGGLVWALGGQGRFAECCAGCCDWNFEAMTGL
jgi:hypothetical protein